MFKVMIALEEVAEVKSLAEACRIFIQKVQEMIADGGASAYIVFEACMIKAKVDGREGIMNFDAIRNFSHSIGILNEDGSLRDIPIPYIPKDIARQVFISLHNDAFEAFLRENLEYMLVADSGPPLSRNQPQNLGCQKNAGCNWMDPACLSKQAWLAASRQSIRLFGIPVSEYHQSLNQVQQFCLGIAGPQKY